MAGVCKGECMGRTPGDDAEMPRLYEAPEGRESVSGRVYNWKVIKGKFLSFPFFFYVYFFFIYYTIT